MSEYKNINKILLGVSLVCFSTVFHGTELLYEEEALRLADLTVPGEKRVLIEKGAPSDASLKSDG